MTRVAALFVWVPLIAAAQDLRDIVRRSVEADRRNTEALRGFAFQERQNESELDSAGKVKQSTIRTWDVTVVEGTPYRRLLARGDQPLSADEQKWEQEKLRTATEQRHVESSEQKAHRIADWQRKLQRQREGLKEILDAFDFRLVHEETLDGFAVWVIDASPKSGYRPKQSSTAYLSKLRGRFWIEKTECQWVKVEIETIDTISFAGFMVRVAKGGRITLEQTRVGDGLWLPKRIAARAFARLFLVKPYRRDLDIGYTNYRKL